MWNDYLIPSLLALVLLYTIDQVIRYLTRPRQKKIEEKKTPDTFDMGFMYDGSGSYEDFQEEFDEKTKNYLLPGFCGVIPEDFKLLPDYLKNNVKMDSTLDKLLEKIFNYFSKEGYTPESIVYVKNKSFRVQFGKTIRYPREYAKGSFIQYVPDANTGVLHKFYYDLARIPK